MEHSPTIGGLISALAKAQAEFTFAAKESKNPAFGSSYADLASVIAAVRPALSKNGIAFLQFDESDVERQTASVTTSLHHGEEWMRMTAEAPATGLKGFNVQSIGSCWTYLRRYTLQALCGLASDDDDGNSLAVDNKPAPKKVAGPTPEDFKMWHEAFSEVQTVEDWNRLIVPMMKERADHPQYGRQFIIAAAEEAKKRGYVGDRTSGAYKLPAKKAPMPTVEEYEAGYEERQGQR